jgi:hypothetical protein
MNLPLKKADPERGRPELDRPEGARATPALAEADPG